jgi:hypothetical protein
MKKKSLFAGMLAMALVFGMAVVGCDNGTTDDGGGGDTVKITSITTSGANMLIQVEYTLATRNEAEIEITFMKESTSTTASSLGEPSISIIKGSGSHLFTRELSHISAAESTKGFLLPYIRVSLMYFEGENHYQGLAEDIKKWK